MSEPLSTLRWSQETAEHNFALAMEQMTIETDRLRTEILRLLTEPDKAPRPQHDGTDGIYVT